MTLDSSPHIWVAPTSRRYLVYRVVMRRDLSAPGVPIVVTSAQPPGSAPTVRANVETRTVDTLTRLKIAGNVGAETVIERDHAVLRQTVDFIVDVHDWALLSKLRLLLPCRFQTLKEAEPRNLCR